MNIKKQQISNGNKNIFIMLIYNITWAKMKLEHILLLVLVLLLIYYCTCECMCGGADQSCHCSGNETMEAMPGQAEPNIARTFGNVGKFVQSYIPDNANKIAEIVSYNLSSIPTRLFPM